MSKAVLNCFICLRQDNLRNVTNFYSLKVVVRSMEPQLGRG